MKRKAELAYVLCAGEGARLRPLTEFIPKPLLPLLDKPMVFHVLDALRDHGVRRFLVNVHHMAADLDRELSAYADRHGISIRSLHEARLLDTGGALRNARAELTEPFWLVNSDFLPAGFSFADMEWAHVDLATLAVAPMPEGATFNPTGVDESGKIVRVGDYFGAGGEDHHFIGVHRLEPEALEFLGDEEIFPLFTGFYDRLFSAGETIGAYRAGDVFVGDPGDFQGYRAAHDFLLKAASQASWIGPGVTGLDQVELGAACVVGKGVSLGAGARLASSILFPGVVIPAGALIDESIVASSPPGDVAGKAFIHGREVPLP